jgi:DNA-binding CsgD family transcriptional regulator
MTSWVIPSTGNLNARVADLADDLRGWLAMSLVRVAELALAHGAVSQASELLYESAELYQRCNDARGLLVCLERLAQAAGAQRDCRRAVQLYAAADALRESRCPSTPASDPALRMRYLDQARVTLGEPQFLALWKAGRQSTDVHTLLRVDPQPSESRAIEPDRGGTVLTVREMDVARLVADGLTNSEIAAQLVISSSTVAVHVKHVLGKLGFKSRAQIASWVSLQGALV